MGIRRLARRTVRFDFEARVQRPPILTRSPGRIAFALALMLLLALPVSALASPVFGEPRQVTFSPYEYEWPVAWSLDGERLLWSGVRNPYPQTAMGFFDSQFQHSVVLREGTGEWARAWSPDGQQIAFTALTASGDAIWIMNADGSNARVVSGTECGEFGYVTGCEFSPDGQYLYYTTRIGQFGPSQAARISVIGGFPEFLGEAGEQPHVSPDGTRIAIANYPDARIIDAGNPASSTSIFVSPGWQVVGAPKWSADGSKLVWVETGYAIDPEYGEVHWRIWVANGDGSEPRVLTAMLEQAREAQISHDGQFIAWSVNKSPLAQTWIMAKSTSGGEVARLPGIDQGDSLVWSTVSNTLAYRNIVYGADDAFLVDVTSDAGADAPQTIALVESSSPSYGSWHDQLARVSLLSDQPGTTYYQWDATSTVGWNWAMPLERLAIPSGEHVLYYYSESANGTEDVQSAVLNMDPWGPTTPVVISGGPDGAGGFDIAWSPVDDQGTGVSHYEAWDGGTWKGQTGGTSWRYSNIDPNASHNFVIVARDRVWNGSSVIWRYKPGSALIPTGTNVRVATGATTVVFPSVSVPGTLTITPVAPRHEDPANFRLLPNMYYDIHPTATFVGPATVTLALPADYAGDPTKLKVFHWKASGWETIAPTVDVASRTVTFQTDSFSDFGFGESAEPPVVVSTPSYSDWSLALFAVLMGAALILVPRRPLRQEVS